MLEECCCTSKVGLGVSGYNGWFLLLCKQEWWKGKKKHEDAKRLELTRAAVRGISTWKRECLWKNLSLLYGALHSQPEPAWITFPAIIGSWESGIQPSKYIIKHSTPNLPVSTPFSGDWPGTGFLSAHVVSTLSVFWMHILTSQIRPLLASWWERKASEMQVLRALTALGQTAEAPMAEQEGCKSKT